MKLTVERTYALKQYENIKLGEEIEVDTDSPEERLKQLMRLELSFRQYMVLFAELKDLTLQESIEYLNDKLMENE